METSNVLRGWREEEYGRSRGGLPLRVQLPDAPVEGLLVATQHGEEAETGLLARRLLERIGGDETAWAVVQVDDEPRPQLLDERRQGERLRLRCGLRPRRGHARPVRELPNRRVDPATSTGGPH